VKEVLTSCHFTGIPASGAVLSTYEITHYQRFVVALKETIRLMEEIDQAIVKWPIE
jgi:hypothetical protein